MTEPINLALYRLLVKSGASEADAKEAARLASDLVTEADLAVTQAGLDRALLDLEARLQRFIIQAMLGMMAIFAIIVGLFRVFT